LDSVKVSGGGFPSERVDYRYDPYGRLVLRTATDSAPSTERLYLYGAGSNSSNITKEVDLVSGNTTEYQYAGIDHPTMSVTRNSAGTVLQSRTYMMDGLGNVVGSALDGSTGAAIIYDSWGNVVTDSTAFMRLGRLRFGFKGMLYDETTGLYNARARWYQPDVGRFMSEDPLGLSAGINQYAFAADDPIDASDPSGLIIPYSLAGVDVTAKADPDPGAIDPPSIMGWLMSLFSSGGNATGGTSAAKAIKQKVCSMIPSGRVVGASGGVGGVVSVGAGGEMVFNYNSGQVSGFGLGGVQAGWNGGASGSVYIGFVYGLNDSNSNYSGGFTGANGASGIGGFAQSSSGGLTGSSTAPNGAVKAVGVSIGGGLLGGFSGGATVTNYTKPVQMGKLSLSNTMDLVLYSARQMCK
jgi:RHS repeat-associated protein